MVRLQPGCTLIGNEVKIVGKENLTSSNIFENIPSILPQLNMSLINVVSRISPALIIKQTNINDVSNMIEDLKFNSLKMTPKNFFK